MSKDRKFNREILKENYGFPIPNVSDANYKEYLKWKRINRLTLSRQASLFLKLFEVGKINTVSGKTKKLFRNGIPPEYRGEIWFTSSGGKKRLKKNPGKYDEYLQTALNAYKSKDDPKMMKHLEQIVNDLKRSFPEHAWFRVEENLNMLRNVLFAYSVHNPDVGYCQGLNFVCGIFLFFLNNEEKTFWTLVCCLEKLPDDMYDPSLNGVYCESFVLCKLIKERRKQIFQVLEKLDFSENEYAIFSTPWFMCLYITIFPIETSLRVMDTFLLEGNKVLFRVAITVLTMAEKELRNQPHKGQVINFLKTYCQNLYDWDTLLKKSFKIRNFSKNKLNKLRKEFRGI